MACKAILRRVICGGSCWRWEVRINIRSYGIVIVRFDGMLCRLKDMRFVWNDWKVKSSAHG